MALFRLDQSSCVKWWQGVLRQSVMFVLLGTLGGRKFLAEFVSLAADTWTCHVKVKASARISSSGRMVVEFQDIVHWLSRNRSL